MRVVADLATANIIQVEKSPLVGEPRAFNGRFAVPIPEMVSVEVNATSYVLPVDGGDVTSEAMAQLLVEFPMYSNILFNPFLTAADVADLDLTATFTPTGDITRAIVGRGAGPLPTGCVPNMIGLLTENDRVVPSRPGVLITDTIDIGPSTGGLGTDEFMLWWKLYEVSTSADVASDYGATAGLDEPAVRSLVEVDPEPAGFEVWLSHDDGANYTQVSRLTPTDLVTFGTLLRVAFLNTSTTTRRFIASFAILY